VVSLTSRPLYSLKKEPLIRIGLEAVAGRRDGQDAVNKRNILCFWRESNPLSLGQINSWMIKIDQAIGWKARRKETTRKTKT
jgi:hypothetical protein